MIYPNIQKAKFIARPNRFIALIEIDGKTEICHVKNTGRCRELLIPGCTIFVEKFDGQKRKTQYDLISVYKGDTLVNIDSTAPNKVFLEWVRNGNFIDNITLIKPESVYHSSRFDFYIQAENRRIFVEVKGVTLEENGVALFPDAPTERGIKHIIELCECIHEGYEAYMVFIIQMRGTKYLMPNYQTHKAFGDALVKANKNGVKIFALDSDVTKTTITARDFVEVRL